LTTGTPRVPGVSGFAGQGVRVGDDDDGGSAADRAGHSQTRGPGLCGDFGASAMHLAGEHDGVAGLGSHNRPAA
jgi:hypothetical protein